MTVDVDGKIMELVKCELCGAMKVEGKDCACQKEVKSELKKGK